MVAVAAWLDKVSFEYSGFIIREARLARLYLLGKVRSEPPGPARGHTIGRHDVSPSRMHVCTHEFVHN